MYSIPQEINKNKIFIVNRSEIAGRWDPHYNKPEYSELYSTLKKRPFVLSHLKEESYSIFSGITPKSGGDAYSEGEDSIPFVRSGDFSETNQIDFSSLLYLKPEIHYGIMSSSQLKRNDLLVAIVGATIGKIGVYTYEREANINQAICGVRLKEHLSPFYVQAFYQTEIGQKIIERIKRPVARANLNLEEIGNLPIPIIDLQNQLMVINILQKGINNKLQKESEARRLLESIDDYLLNELEISLPEVKTDLKSRMFLVNRSELGDRLDPFYIMRSNNDIRFSKYDIKKLGEIASIVKGNSLTSKAVIPGFVPVIAGGKSSPYCHNISNFQGNIITVSASGAYAGYVWYHSNPIFATDCNVIISNNETFVTAQYISEIMKLQQDRIYDLQSGAAQPHVYPDDLKKLSIPIPPLAKQKEITSHITAIRQQAKRLQEEGKAILENAKKEIERMIIG